MQRSGMRPLALHIDLSTKHFIDAAFSTTPATLLHSTLSILKPHFDRVMVLDIKAAREELSQFLFHLGRTKRPNLRRLRVVFDSKEATFLPLAFDLSVTQNLIARAEVVMLTDVVVYWTDLRNLTKLRIQLDPSRSRDAYARKMSCTTAITMLRFSPALEELVLQNCFKYSPLEIDLTSTSPPVHLPVLRVCNLCASGSVCATILAATRIPPLARLQVEVSEEDWDERAVRVLLEVLRTSFAQPGAPTLRVLQIDDRKSGEVDPGCCQCYRWFADLALDQFESFAEPGAAEEMANLSLRMPGNNGERGRWLLQHVLYSGPAKDVQVCDWPMCVPAWRAWPHDVLCDLLRLLPALQSLVLRHTGAKNVLRLRAALQQMVMHDVCNELSEEEPPKGMTIYWIQLLHQSLQAESTKKIRELVDAQMLAGRPLQRLFLHPEFLDQEHLKILIERWATREVKVGTEEATFIEVELV